MSVTTKTRKRKSGDDVVSVAKKPKTAKSADQLTPLKSALKKSKVDTPVEERPESKKTRGPTRSSAKVPEVKQHAVPELSDDDEEQEDGGAELTADRTAELLAGFSSSEDEASEAEENDDGIALSKIPSAPVQKLDKKAAQAAADLETTPGVVHISRIPHGFYEKQMRAYFSQFGTITHLRLGRSKKTGKAQHYAFIEFASAAVAEIVAKTMDKYLLFGHILQCRKVPQEQIKEGLWKAGKAKNGKVRPRNKMEGSRLRKGADREQWEKRVRKEERRRSDKARKLKELGYEFDMPGLKSVDEVPAKAKELEAGSGEAGAEEEGGVKLLEGKKVEVAPGVEEKIEKIVQTAADTPEATEEKVTKRKNKGGGVTTTTKKRKVKAAV